MPSDAAHQEASQEAPRCPICGHSLEISSANKGWLISYPIAACSHCGARMEVKESSEGKEL